MNPTKRTEEILGRLSRSVRGAKNLLNVTHPQEDKSSSKPENQHAGQNS
jgi:hypothetical protein